MQQVESLVIQESKSTLFLKTLKESTSHDHLRLESNDLLSSLMSPEITLHQYYCYLRIMQNISIAYENSVQQNLPILMPGWVTRNSSFVIQDDLDNLHYIHPRSSSFINYQITIDSNDPGQLLGFTYVMEGSRLGGKVIYKNIHHQLGITEGSGAKYLSDYGFATGSRWKKFIMEMAAFVADKNIEQSTIDSAAKAFASIYEFFESNRKFYEI